MKMRIKVALLTVAASAITSMLHLSCGGFGDWGRFLGDLVGDQIFLRGVD